MYNSFPAFARLVFCKRESTDIQTAQAGKEEVTEEPVRRPAAPEPSAIKLEEECKT
jgi:hypothetical protein